jgi:type VI secretion system protein ImpE
MRMSPLCRTSHAADLASLFAEVQDSVRKEPTKVEHRAALFQLYCAIGEWDKGLKQLTVLHKLDLSTKVFCFLHRSLIACNGLRDEVFAGRCAPPCLGHPPAWLGPLAEALRCDRDGRPADAKMLREQAFAQAEAILGQANGKPFAWIADVDGRLGPVLEAIVDRRYLWIPFDRLKRIEIEPPADFKDLIWLPVKLTLANQAEVAGFVPTRYPGSEAQKDDAIRLARRTAWHQPGGGSWVGFGQRMLATDAGEHALLDIRVIELHTPPAGQHG